MRRGLPQHLLLLLLLSAAAAVAAAAQVASTAGSNGTTALLPAQLPAQAVGHSGYDFWLLALFWPPSVVPPAAHGRARHLIIRHQAHAGFWTHGLWPVSHDIMILEYCSKAKLEPRSLAGFEPALRYYLRSGDFRADAASGGDFAFWDHEWQRHGTCSELDQLGYFLALFHASAATDPAAALRSAGVLPSNLAPYTLQQITTALTAAYKDGFNRHIGLRCEASADGRTLLKEVRLCVAKGDFSKYNCSAYASWVRPGIKLDTCGEDPAAPIWLPAYDDKASELSLPWGLLGLFGGVISLLAGGLVGGYLLMKQANRLPAVFKPKQVQLVHYDLVHTPVRVIAEPLDTGRLWDRAPYIAEFVEDLPVGMGIKGGIARKLLKELYGTPEPPGSFDIDVAVFIEHYTHEDRKAARELVTGLRIGGLVLEAKDVEVMSKAWLPEYFTSRDVTMNEVLIVKQAPGAAMFYYTRDALRDVQLQLIRPSVHTLKSEYNLNWGVEDNGTPFVAPSQLCRCLVRYLKGHGLDYALDATTWAHYRRERLNKLQLFKVLRAFHDDGAALQAAVDHLVDIGFLCRRDVLRAGGVNMLWGLLLQEVNATIVQSSAGRLTLGELDTEGVERWVDHKKAQVASKLIANEMRGRRTGFMPADEGVEDLGLLHLPQELEDFITAGPTFDLSQRLDSETNAAVNQLSASFSAPGAAGGMDMPSAASAASASKRMWAAQRAVTETSSDALLSIARQRFTAPSGTSPAAPWLSTSPQIARMLSSEVADGDVLPPPPLPPAAQQVQRQGSRGKGTASPDPSGRSSSSNARRLDELAQLKRSATERSNKAYMMQQQSGSFSSHGPGAAAASAPGSAAALAAAAASADEERIWLRYSEVGRWTEGDDSGQAQLGTFYQVLDTAEWQDGEREYAELISDDERPRRQRLPISRLLGFAAGVGLMNLRLLAGAYGLLLLAMVFRLAVPRVEGAIFDAFNSLEIHVFSRDLALAVGLVAADVTLSVSGRIVLEVFARKTMRSLFASFFDHILGQELTFFNRLPAGELMARTSGDSLTLRSMFTSTTYQLVEGSTLTLGSAACLLITLGPLWWRVPALGLALLLGLLLSGLEGFATGLGARALNLKLRQSLGRMFGFTLDVFSKMDTVGALGLEGRLLADYRFFARDYFRNTFRLNTLLVLHRGFTYALSAGIRGAMLWFGGVALFADLTTVGTLFMMLRYVTWMQRGIKTASDAYARIMASVGSLERVVELHDRGVFRDAAQSLGRELVPVVQDDDEDGDGDGDGGYGGAPGGDSGVTQPLLQRVSASLRQRWNPGGPKMVLRVVPPEPRPDFGAMLGGVRLCGVHLTLRSKTDRLVLADASLELLRGQAAIVTGKPGGGKSSLLQLIMLRHMPYKGYLAFQLPLSAIPAGASGRSSAEGAPGAPPPAYQLPAAVFLDGSSGVGSTAGGGGGAGGGKRPATSLSYSTAPGGAGWVWAQFSFLKDDQAAARAVMAMASLSAAGLFRTTVEDNVACASRRPITSADVREACRKVGAHEFIMAMPEGYRTLVGDGSGTHVSYPLLLMLTLARALVRRPRLMLLDDADAFASALGAARLNDILADLQADGVTVVMAAERPALFPGLRARVFGLHDGRLFACDGDEAQAAA